MPVARIQMPDGRIARYEVPEGTTAEEAQQYAENIQAQPSVMSSVPWELQGQVAQNQQNVAASGTTSRFLQGLQSGLQQPYIGAKELLGKVSPEEVLKQRQLAQPLQATTAGQVGNFVGQAAPYVAASAVMPGSGSLLGSIAAQGALGAAQGALTPTAPGEMPIENFLKGGVGGATMGGIGYGLGRLATPIPNVSPAKVDLARQARQLGYQILPSQITGSKFLRQGEIASGIGGEANAANTLATNKLAASAIGQPQAEALTPDVINAAFAANQAERARLVAGTTLNTAQPAYKAALTDIIKDYSNNTPEGKRSLSDIIPWMQDLLNAATNGRMPGEVYQNTYSQLTRLARTPGPAQSYYSRMARALDTAAESNTSFIPAAIQGGQPANTTLMTGIPNAAAWQANRATYRNLLALDKPNVIDAEGNVKGAALWNIVGKQNGLPELRQAATIAKTFPPVPEGGANLQGMGGALKYAGMSGLLGAAGGSIGSYYYGARDPSEIAKMAALGAATTATGPRLLQAAMGNPILSAYMTRGLAGGANLTPYLTGLSPFGAQANIQNLQGQYTIGGH